MMTLRGMVTSRHGIASKCLEGITPLIGERIGVQGLVTGTFNIQLPQPYIVEADALVRPHEYNDLETLKLKRCRVGGLRCCIMRPDSHETPGNDVARVLEIMSDRRLRTELGLKDGDQAEVELEGDDDWWHA